MKGFLTFQNSQLLQLKIEQHLQAACCSSQPFLTIAEVCGNYTHILFRLLKCNCTLNWYNCAQAAIKFIYIRTVRKKNCSGDCRAEVLVITASVITSSLSAKCPKLCRLCFKPRSVYSNELFLQKMSKGNKILFSYATITPCYCFQFYSGQYMLIKQ